MDSISLSEFATRAEASESKVIIFQFKLLHRRLVTNSFLKKMGIKQSDLCTFCKTEAESLIHLFWSCGVTSIFWQEFKQWITTNYEIVTSNFSPATVLGFKPFFVLFCFVLFFFLRKLLYNRALTQLTIP